MDAIMVWACLYWLMDGWVGSMDAIMDWEWMTGQWMGWRHGRYHGLGMDALANGWVAIKVWVQGLLCTAWAGCMDMCKPSFYVLACLQTQCGKRGRSTPTAELLSSSKSFCQPLHWEPLSEQLCWQRKPLCLPRMGTLKA